jgi:hypothetical protein
MMVAHVEVFGAERGARQPHDDSSFDAVGAGSPVAVSASVPVSPGAVPVSVMPASSGGVAEQTPPAQLRPGAQSSAVVHAVLHAVAPHA